MLHHIDIETIIKRRGYSDNTTIKTYCSFHVARPPFWGSFSHSVNNSSPIGIVETITGQSKATNLAELLLEANQAHAVIVESEIQKLIAE